VQQRDLHGQVRVVGSIVDMCELIFRAGTTAARKGVRYVPLRTNSLRHRGFGIRARVKKRRQQLVAYVVGAVRLNGAAVHDVPARIVAKQS
jgi:hypothetical protein